MVVRRAIGEAIDSAWRLQQFAGEFVKSAADSFDFGGGREGAEAQPNRAAAGQGAQCLMHGRSTMQPCADLDSSDRVEQSCELLGIIPLDLHADNAYSLGWLGRTQKTHGGEFGQCMPELCRQFQFMLAK